MTKEELAKQAFEECCSPLTTVRYGEKNKSPFWNLYSTQFMYVPAFHFTGIMGVERYRFDAMDEKGTLHTFEADDCCALLTPVWRDLPEGVVTLKVTALDKDGNNCALVGARTFFKLSPFTADTLKASCSYSESAVKAYKYAFSQPFIRHWLEYGTPDPYYDLNIYPSKMISALAKAMISYSRLCPEDAEDAMKVATSAADYLMSITPREGALANLPPTYSADFCPDPDKYGIKTCNWYNAVPRFDMVMMIYPASVGRMYIELEKATGEKKYLDEAMKIGKYYLETVEENGSWYLMRSASTGEVLNPNFISPMSNVVPFLMELYECTGDARFSELAEKAIEYVLKTQYTTYNWEGQFEDSGLSVNYSNLTHFDAVALAKHFAQYYSLDEKRMEIAKELMRYVEDQFVIWKRPSPFAQGNINGSGPYNTSLWHTPCGLEQYNWYVPIDSSTAAIALGFLALYKAGCGELYLAKARALVDQLTNVQRENGQIPTHWMEKEDDEMFNFWFNCMFFSCTTLETMSEYENKNTASF